MSDDLQIEAYDEKALLARKDVPTIDALRDLPRQKLGAAFLIDGKLFVWMTGDHKPDDGETSIARREAPPQMRGRYRLAVPLVP